LIVDTAHGDPVSITMVALSQLQQAEQLLREQQVSTDTTRTE
jgi:hypothetical protein